MSARVSGRALSLTAIALLALWLLSFGLSFAHLGGAALAVALTIAAVKATLVALFFMELICERFTINLTVAAAGGLIATLIALMVADVNTRAVPPLVPPIGAASR
jgi:cytochrome c oxidase subunit 4